MNQLVILAKHWTPGRAKTRLIPSLGAERAAELHRLFLMALVERFRRVGSRRVITFTPSAHRVEFASLGGQHWRCEPQAGGDLGARMRSCFERAFAAGMRRVVLIGADSPTVPTRTIRTAFALLRDAPVVLGPAVDGGYYLIGAADGAPPVFTGIAWGTKNVWRQTVARLRSARLPFRDLPPWYDVDSPFDLPRLHCDLDRLARRSHFWARFRRRVVSLLDPPASSPS